MVQADISFVCYFAEVPKYYKFEWVSFAFLVGMLLYNFIVYNSHSQNKYLRFKKGKVYKTYSGLAANTEH